MHNRPQKAHTISGDKMENIDVRKYIINNFKEDSTSEIAESINTSIESKSEDPLIGLGVLFELMWNNSTNDTKDTILSNIKKGLTNN